ARPTRTTGWAFCDHTPSATTPRATTPRVTAHRATTLSPHKDTRDDRPRHSRRPRRHERPEVGARVRHQRVRAVGAPAHLLPLPRPRRLDRDRLLARAVLPRLLRAHHHPHALLAEARRDTAAAASHRAARRRGGAHPR